MDAGDDVAGGDLLQQVPTRYGPFALLRQSPTECSVTL